MSRTGEAFPIGILPAGAGCGLAGDADACDPTRGASTSTSPRERGSDLEAFFGAFWPANISLLTKVPRV